MASRDQQQASSGGGGGERPADRTTGHAQQGGPGTGARAGEGPNVNAPSERYVMAETALGGADAVQKTTYGAAKGGEPAGAPTADVTAQTGTGGGMNVAAWIVALIAVAIALVYGVGIFG